MLSLLREGLSNPEIAERLGISRDAAKYHVSGILSKLGVETREESAVWQPEPPRVAAVRRPAWASALAPLAGALRGLPAAGKVAAVGVTAAVVAGVVVAFGVLGGNEGEGDVVLNPSVTATPGEPTAIATQAVTATPGPTSNVAADFEYTVGEPIEFPDDLAMIVETGCWGCDGGAGGFVRVYKRPDGSFGQDVLFRTEQLGLPEDGDNWQPYILGFAMRQDASEMAMVVCETAYCGGLGSGETNSVARVYRSLDGGVTWVEWMEWPLNHYAVGLVDGGILAAHQVNVQPEQPDPPATPRPYVDPVYEYVRLPGGETVTAPTPGGVPLVSDTGRIWWAGLQGKLSDEEGVRVLAIEEPGARISAVYGDAKPGLDVVWRTDDQSGDYYISHYEGSTLISTGKTSYSLLAHVGPLDGKSSTLYGNVDAFSTNVPLPSDGWYGLIPVQIDTVTGIARPIPWPFVLPDFVLPNARNRVAAVQQGPFARVVGTGSCLNVREEPSAGARVVECVADGVLLLNVDATSNLLGVPTPGWLQVMTPGKAFGFVSTDYIEY